MQMQNKSIIAASCFLCLLVVVSRHLVLEARQQKLKPEELVAKHLDSIGTPEARKAVSSRTTSGTVQVNFRVGGSGTLNGKANILSQQNLLRLGFGFGAIEYPGEQIAFDGNKVTAGMMSPGNYPPFAGFIYEHDFLVKEGLLFGSLSTGWGLNDIAAKRARMDSTGVKKIDGRQLYELKYNSRNSRANVQAWFYFEPETFRHVRSQFKLEVPASRMSTITDSAEMVRYQIVERFAEFKPVDGLTLPHSHNVEFTVDAPRGGMLTTWTHSIETITHGEALNRELFSMNSK
jgi:hypothetical protein